MSFEESAGSASSFENSSSPFHSCTGLDCSFCEWRKNKPTELGWEKLFDDEPVSSSTICGVELTASQVADPTAALSTQQTSDKLSHLEFNDQYFRDIDQEFKQILSKSNSQVVNGEDTGVCLHQPESVVPKRKFSSPKGKDAVRAARDSSVPTKTKDATNWAIRLWTSRAITRNQKLLPDEMPFNSDICLLTVPEMNFWLSRFVLEVHKKMGNTTHLTLYQLVAGLQRYLQSKGLTTIKLFDHTFFTNFSLL